MDKIVIKGLKVYAFHGVNPEEKKDGQNFIFDVTLYKNLERPCKSDCVEDTVSYAKVLKTIIRVASEKSYDLIEKVAQRVAEQILKEFEVDQVDVVLKKPDAPMKADFDYVAVEISRKKGV